MARLRKEHTLVSDVHKELSWWYCYSRESAGLQFGKIFLLPEDFPWPEVAVFDPVYRIAPKIGRNEPCPCGSSKKFKKCCGK